MRLLLVGSSGLVGRDVLSRALADPRVTQVTALVRRALPEHPKLHCEVVDFDVLPADAAWWQADAVICTLGTTMRNAGSRESFRRVDHDYPLAVAEIARRHSTPTYVLNSAAGANADSSIFYSRVKGEVERELERIGFASLTFVRPGLIGGERDEFRLGERAMLVALRALEPILPRKWRINPAENIAGALLRAAIEAPAGTHVIGAETLA